AAVLFLSPSAAFASSCRDRVGQIRIRDERVREFRLLGCEAAERLNDGSSVITVAGRTFDLQWIENDAVSVHIEFTSKKIEVPIDGRWTEVCAVNSYLGGIRGNQDCWDKKDHDAHLGLALHEFLGLRGIEINQYEVTLLLQGRMNRAPDRGGMP